MSTRSYRGRHRMEVPMRPRRVRRGLALLAFGGLIAAAGLATTSRADAAPGQCFTSPWGGFCDGPAAADGTWTHCEGALGFTNCFRVRPVGTDVDPRGWTPA